MINLFLFRATTQQCPLYCYGMVHHCLPRYCFVKTCQDTLHKLHLLYDNRGPSGHIGMALLKTLFVGIVLERDGVLLNLLTLLFFYIAGLERNNLAFFLLQWYFFDYFVMV